MPTSTVPFEVLFEFTNDTSDVVTLQLIHGDDDFPNGGAMILLHPSENVSLVLNAGSTYRYTVVHGVQKAQIVVKAWQDTQCDVTSVLERKEGCVNGASSWALPQGITITSVGVAQDSLEL